MGEAPKPIQHLTMVDKNCIMTEIISFVVIFEPCQNAPISDFMTTETKCFSPTKSP